MAQTFSQLLQDVYDALGGGITKGLIATGGSTSTVVDSTISEDYQDDDFKDFTLFVRRDAGGANAAPQNDIRRVSGYAASTWTVTVSSNFSAAIAAGDEVLLAKPYPFPLADVKRLCNAALRSLGTITRYDTSLTADGSESYTLPDDVRTRPNRIWVDDGDGYVEVPQSGYSVQAGAEGADWTLYMEGYSSGTIKLEYQSVHATLADYNHYVSETIPYPLAVAICAWYCAKWQAMNDENWAGRAAELRQLYELERARNPVYKKPAQSRGFPIWS